MGILKFKKLFAVSLALLLCLSLSACKGDEGNKGGEVEVGSHNSSKDISGNEFSSMEFSGESVNASSSDSSSSSEPDQSGDHSGDVSSKPAQPTTGLRPPQGSGITPAEIVNIKAPNGTLYNKNGTYQDYKTPMDMEDNIFMDSLAYTGYNVDRHRADGLMWQYILSGQKKRAYQSGPYNWLSNISYHGTPSGYEKTKNGKPDIKYFEKYGLVCASYVGYVYQNYLPNVVGIDTSMLGKPSDYGWSDVLADGWYEVGKTWVEKGWSEFIEFDCRTVPGSGGQLRITPEKDIPIGSLIVTANDSNPDTDYAGHVSIYAGYKDGYNWVYQVGTYNGPEFCSIERMGYNPDPHYRQWLIAIITPPNIINYAPTLEVTVQDNEGNPVKGASVKVQRSKDGSVIELGETGVDGKISKDYLYYEEMTLTVTTPSGLSDTCSITLSAKNNSINTVTATVK